MSEDVRTPWLTLKASCAYTQRGPRSLRAAVKRGELRAAQLGGQRVLLFRAEWLDQWLEALAPPIRREAPPAVRRRRNAQAPKR
jgi:hypothetical protein